MKNVNILIAALGGVIVGAALGVLFAPEKGANTRDKIKDFLKEHGIKLRKNELDKVVDEIVDEINVTQA